MSCRLPAAHRHASSGHARRALFCGVAATSAPYSSSHCRSHSTEEKPLSARKASWPSETTRNSPMGRSSQFAGANPKALPLLFVGATVSPDEDDQRRQALLVDRTAQQLGDVLQVEACVAPRDDTHRRDSHAKEDVPLAVPTGTRLEEPLELRHALRLGGLKQFAAQLVQVGGRWSAASAACVSGAHQKGWRITVLFFLGAVRLGSVR